MIESLENWIKENNIEVEVVSDELLKIDDATFFILPFKEKLFNKELFFILEEEEIEFLTALKEEFSNLNILYQFSDKWFYSPLKVGKDKFNEVQLKFELKPFLYLGKSTKKITFPFVGIHSEYELLNVVHNYTNALKKLKFLGAERVGLCDYNTLAAIIGFQLKCRELNLKPIFGETVGVAYDYSKEKQNQIIHKVKLYVLNETGWFNLLKINRKINTEYNNLFIPEEEFLLLSEGLICVFDYSDSVLFGLTAIDEYSNIVSKYKERFGDNLFYQFSSVRYVDEEYDLKCLKSFKFHFENFKDTVPFLLIDDCYYLEKAHSECKTIVNKIAQTVHQPSDYQYIKNEEQLYLELEDIFVNTNLHDFLNELKQNNITTFEQCNYVLPLNENKIPVFDVEGEFLSEEESVAFLRMLCEEGFADRVVGKFEEEQVQIYRERFEKEFAVIEKSGFSDYFLILYDIIKFAKDDGQLVGPGRGSVGGSLLAYLLYITDIDPIKHDLMFERFLNEARITPDIYIELTLKDGKKLKFKEGDKSLLEIPEDSIESRKEIKEKRGDSLPDIDVDFLSRERDNVKQYIVDRFGSEYVCSLGTYGRMKLRQAFKDIAKQLGISFQEANDITAEIDDQVEYTIEDFFKFALGSEKFYKFIQKNFLIVEYLMLIINNPKSVSIHPSAVAILPRKDVFGRDRSLETWLPIRLVDNIIVSEWEGKYTDKFGVLKEDILGIKQLDRFEYCLELIRKNHDIKIDLNDIPLDDESTFKLFQKGLNEDVFQFSSNGLKNYSREVKPDCFDDIVAMNALYRPGPMESGFHSDYAKIKNKEKKPTYFYGMKEVTESTYGLFVYQEQIMQAVMVGGLSAVESDQVRSTMKKKDVKVLESFREKFVRGMVERGCVEDEAKNIWNKLLAFSGYGFNKSHSAAYALMAYQCQWLKANFPLEFWTTAFNFGKEDVDIPFYISEIREGNFDIKISSPNINTSDKHFTCSVDDNSLYWSLVKIKGVGDAVADSILNERRERGEFKSLEDFINRKTKANKKHIKIMILCGCFDKLENISNPVQRRDLLIKYYTLIKQKQEECEYLNHTNTFKGYYWVLLQKSFIGHGNINYTELVESSKEVDASCKKKFMTNKNLLKKSITSTKFYNKGEEVFICGYVMDVKVKTHKNDPTKKFAFLEVDQNGVKITVTFWNDTFSENEEFILSTLNKVIGVNGGLGVDDHRKVNTVYAYENTSIYVF